MISVTEEIVGHVLMFHLMNYHVSVGPKLAFRQSIVELNLLYVRMLVQEIMNVLTRSGKIVIYMGLGKIIIPINILLRQTKNHFSGIHVTVMTNALHAQNLQKNGATENTR